MSKNQRGPANNRPNPASDPILSHLQAQARPGGQMGLIGPSADGAAGGGNDGPVAETIVPGEAVAIAYGEGGAGGAEQEPETPAHLPSDPIHKLKVHPDHERDVSVAFNNAHVTFRPGRVHFVDSLQRRILEEMDPPLPIVWI